MGRRSKATEGRIEVMLASLGAGSTRTAAAAHAGVNRTTAYRWQRDATIRARVEKAEADFEVRSVAQIAQAGGEDWHAAAWLLERRRAASYGRAQTLAAAVDQMAPVELAPHPLEGLSKAEQAGRMREYADLWAAEAAEEPAAVEMPEEHGPADEATLE